MNGKQAELFTYNSDFDEKVAANVAYFFRCASVSAKKYFVRPLPVRGYRQAQSIDPILFAHLR